MNTWISKTLHNTHTHVYVLTWVVCGEKLLPGKADFVTIPQHHGMDNLRFEQLYKNNIALEVATKIQKHGVIVFGPMQYNIVPSM